ncbi:MAG: hypothetical protein OEZ59_02505, partial [Deltaproteobacteria bacterium]|nr:hypothetical protein [Deltaproteobacteria bacterium]
MSSWSSAVLTWMMLAVLLASPGMLRAGQMEDLQGDDLPTRLEALRELRTDPDKTRLAILEILSAPLDTAGAKKARKTTALPPEKTARLVYHFTEFALPEDMGLLAQLLEKTEHDIVRKALENTLKALYQPTGAVEQLSFLTQDLTFVQEGQPRLIENKLSGRWFYTPWSYRVLHREGLSTEMIERLSPFANRSFESREEALEEIKKALKPGEWTKYEALLSEAIDKVEDRAEISGRVRVRLTNPLQTPVMVRLWLHVWYGLFRNAPPEPMV